MFISKLLASHLYTLLKSKAHFLKPRLGSYSTSSLNQFRFLKKMVELIGRFLPKQSTATKTKTICSTIVFLLLDLTLLVKYYLE